MEVGKNYTTVYAGGGYAFGEGFDAPGWRLRAVGAWGTYDYERVLFDGSAYRRLIFGGQVLFLAAQAGYQLQFGRSVAKAFAGIEAVDQAIVLSIPATRCRGARFA